MNKYLVRVEGENFKIRAWWRTRTYGFFTTRFVEAANAEEAETAAIDLLRRDEHLTRVVRNKPGDDPKMYVREIVELESFEGRHVPGAGFTFYRAS